MVLNSFIEREKQTIFNRIKSDLLNKKENFTFTYRIIKLLCENKKF